LSVAQLVADVGCRHNATSLDVGGYSRRSIEERFPLLSKTLRDLFFKLHMPKKAQFRCMSAVLDQPFS